MSDIPNPQRRGLGRPFLPICAVLVLGACAEGQGPAFLQGGDTVTRASAGQAAEADEVAERDVEAPDVFQATEAGLWDGRPSLGGVWAAHPDVGEPERVIIRNQQNGRFVVGALFRRERETPGPRLQISSDAAAALGMLAGQPTNLDVVALRREEVRNGRARATETPVPEAPEVSEAGLDPVASDAERAIESAALTPAAEQAASTPQPRPEAPTPASGSGLDLPYIQLGIFSIEQNARNTATAMRQAGMVPTVEAQTINGRTFWRVVVGPAQTAEERGVLLETIRSSGFSDAFAVGG